MLCGIVCQKSGIDHKRVINYLKKEILTSSRVIYIDVFLAIKYYMYNELD